MAYIIPIMPATREIKQKDHGRKEGEKKKKREGKGRERKGREGGS